MVRILGIDPGLRHTGWGVIEAEDRYLRFIAAGTIHTDSKTDMVPRLGELSMGIQAVLIQHSPKEVAVEETFVNKNPGTSLKLGHARGALITTASLAGFAVASYSATKVKKSVTGVGGADKNQVMMMVKTLMPQAIIDSADAADALAVAICHAHYRNARIVA